MKQGTSIFLDALRVASALGVFVSHCLLGFFSSFPVNHLLHTSAHACVMVFFVLSGYLITFTTLGRGRTWPQYCAARLARLYSVALPALVLTAVLWLLGEKLAPAHYEAFDRGHGVFRLLITTFFMNECWFFSAAPPTNLPFWSLSYEFWYYAIFGAAFFARGVFWKGAAAVGVALICGPKILLLFPVWLAGAAAFFAGKKIAMSRGSALAALVVLVAACAAAAPFVSLPLERFGHPPLFYSAMFWWDCALGLVFAVAIFLGDQLLREVKVPAGLSAAIKAGAGVTFSIYLLHYPLLVFLSGVVPYDKTNPIAVAALGGAALVAAIGIGYWFERRATLKWLSDRLEALFTRRNRASLSR